MLELQALAKNFRAPPFPGSYFLSFEGIEGSGKSTQILKLKNYLEEQKFRVIVLREPGGTVFGERLRKAILDSKNDVHPMAEALLFTSARVQLLHEVVLSELNTPGTIVILDRYFDSTLAYQGEARGLGPMTVMELHNCYPLNLLPHKTFYLKIDLETSLERQKMRNQEKDYFESKDNEFHKKLIDGYECAAKIFPERIVTIEGKRDTEDVFEDIKKTFLQLTIQ
jgi:dTMP kinase